MTDGLTGQRETNQESPQRLKNKSMFTLHLLDENLSLEMFIKTLASNLFKLVLGTKEDFIKNNNCQT